MIIVMITTDCHCSSVFTGRANVNNCSVSVTIMSVIERLLKVILDRCKGHTEPLNCKNHVLCYFVINEGISKLIQSSVWQAVNMYVYNSLSQNINIIHNWAID